MVINAIYENDVLKPFGKLDLRDGEEVEIELKRKAEKKARHFEICRDLKGFE